MNLLVTGAFSWTRDELAELKSLGHNVVFMQHEKDKLPCKADWVEGIIGNGIFLTHPIESFTSLKYIQLTSAGYDRVPMEYIKKHHIQIFNARGVYSIPMAEFVLTSVLDLYKRNRYFRENQKKGFGINVVILRNSTEKTSASLVAGVLGQNAQKDLRPLNAE